MNNQAGSRLTQHQGLLQVRDYQSGWYLLVEVPTHHAPRARIAPTGQIAPAPADQGKVGDIPDPDLIGRGRHGLTEEQIFGHDCC